MSSCIINVKALAESDAQTANIHLDNTFFKCFHSSDISGGKVDVVAKSTKTAVGNEYEVALEINGFIKIPCTRCLDEMNYEIKLDDRFKAHAGEYISDEDADYDIIPAKITGECDVAERIFETIVLNIPSVHSHSDGLCNIDMIEKLKEHSASEITKIIN